MKPLLAIALLFMIGVFSSARAEITPLNEPLVEEQETLIACDCLQAPSRTDIPVLDSAKDAENTKGTYHYKLWLPKGYLADSTRQWPCMFIMSPNGKAGMGKMAEYLKSNNFIVIMLVEAKNGAWGPIIGNFLAAHDDAIKRLRIKEGLKFATGQSGGARASSVFVQTRPGFGGLILQSAGAAYDVHNNYWVSKIKQNSSLYVVMLMGDSDSNKPEVSRMKTVIPSLRFHDIEFTGGHTWAPPETFEQAMGWIKGKMIHTIP